MNLSDVRGRAEILLRLTGLSSVVEAAMGGNRVSKDEGEQLMASLDDAATIINTRDLSPLEVEALRRRLQRLVKQIASLSA